MQTAGKVIDETVAPWIPLDELLLYNPSSCFKICVNDSTGYGYAGCVNKHNRISAIDNLSANKKEVILHEMIHAMRFY